MDYRGKKVRLLLQGNIIIEGVVKSWSSSSVHLISSDGKSTSIITHPNEDIRVIKVIHEDVVREQIQEETLEKSSPQESLNEIKEKFNETYNLSSDDEFRMKNLIELRKELIKQEKEVIASKLRDHHVGEVREVRYEQPGFFKKQSTK